MGGGTYSTTNAAVMRESKGSFTNTVDQNFTQRQIHHTMNPVDISLREARDSDEHPNSLAILLGLDLTGSMGSIPQMLVQHGLPRIMGKIIHKGEPDPQLLFVGVGDHEVDTSPLQVGQFESNDEKLDHWLENTFLEGGGGGNAGESYLLAWYFAARYTSIDCMEKRGRKGVLITIGDEPTLTELPVSAQRELMGKNGQYSAETAAGLLEAAQKSWDVYHIHLLSTGAGARFKDHAPWQQLLGPNYLSAQTADDVADTVIAIIATHPEAPTASMMAKVPDTHDAEEVL